MLVPQVMISSLAFSSFCDFQRQPGGQPIDGTAYAASTHARWCAGVHSFSACNGHAVMHVGKMSNDPLDEYEQFDFAEINLRQAALRDVQELKTKLRAAIKKRHTAKNVTLRDKISFVVGTMLAFSSCYWLGYSPATFNRSIYTGAAIVLFILRYLIYRVKKWHYYGELFFYSTIPHV